MKLGFGNGIFGQYQMAFHYSNHTDHSAFASHILRRKDAILRQNKTFY